MILYILSNRLSVQKTSNYHKYFRHAQSAMPVSQDPINISQFALYTDNPSLHDLLCLNVCKSLCMCMFVSILRPCCSHSNVSNLGIDFFVREHLQVAGQRQTHVLPEIVPEGKTVLVDELLTNLASLNLVKN